MTRGNAHMGGHPVPRGVHPVMAYAERLRRKGVPFSDFKYMKNVIHIRINLSPQGFSPPPGKALDEANYMYLSIINRKQIVEIKTVFPSSKVTIKKVQYYSIS